jgi:hypothetical protein
MDVEEGKKKGEDGVGVAHSMQTFYNASMLAAHKEPYKTIPPSCPELKILTAVEFYSCNSLLVKALWLAPRRQTSWCNE